MLNIPDVCLRFHETAMSWISNFSESRRLAYLLSHLKRYDGLFASPSFFDLCENFLAADGPIAQLRLERTPDKREVTGSSPVRPTTHNRLGSSV